MGRESSAWLRAAALLEQHGKYVRNTPHGTMWELRGSDGVERVVLLRKDRERSARSDMNMLSEVRRALRAVGALVVEVEPDEPAEGEEIMDVAKMREALLRAGGHVTRKVRRVETVDAVVDLESLVVALGLVGEDQRPSAVVSCVDASGKAVPGPITLRVIHEGNDE